jgi:hypothetical protein
MTTRIAIVLAAILLGSCGRTSPFTCHSGAPTLDAPGEHSARPAAHPRRDTAADGGEAQCDRLLHSRVLI